MKLIVPSNRRGKVVARIKPAYAIVAALWLMASVTGVQSQTVDIAAAKKDAKVVVYGSVVPQAT